MKLVHTALAIVVFGLATSGRTITLSPGVESVEDNKIPAIGKGEGTPVPGPGAGEVTSKFGLNTFVLERKNWNQTLAVRFKGELEKRGVGVGKGPEIQLNVTDYHYNQLDVVVTVYEAKLGIDVTIGEWKKHYTGSQSSPLSSSNAVWQAAGHAFTQIMADPEFRKAIKAE